MLAEMSAAELVEWQLRDAMHGEIRALVEQGMDADVAARFVFSPKDRA